MNSITVVVGIPHKILNPNNAPRTAHGIKGKDAERKRQRDSAWKCSLSALDGRDAPMWEYARVHARYYHKNKRNMGKRDADNAIASLKGAIDGIADAGIVVNDSGIRWGEVELEHVDPSFPRVELVVFQEV